MARIRGGDGADPGGDGADPGGMARIRGMAPIRGPELWAVAEYGVAKGLAVCTAPEALPGSIFPCNLQYF